MAIRLRYLAGGRASDVHPVLGHARAAGGADRSYLRCGGGGCDPAHRSGAAGCRTSEANSGRKYPDQRTERGCRHRSALCCGGAAALAVASLVERSGPLVWEFVFYATFGLVVTSSVAIAGVLLVFSFLIVPAAIGIMFASSLARQLAIGWVVGTSPVRLALPPLLPSICRRVRPWFALLAVRWAGGAGLPVFAWQSPNGTTRCDGRRPLEYRRDSGGSAFQMVAAPRADQPSSTWSNMPLLAANVVFHARRGGDLRGRNEYAERHRIAAERLNDLERRRRSEGEALDDASVGRISSFLKSYGEMRKGEQFVMGEVRARARERVRWGISLALLAFAILVVPVSWGACGCAHRARCGEGEAGRALMSESGLAFGSGTTRRGALKQDGTRKSAGPYHKPIFCLI